MIGGEYVAIVMVPRRMTAERSVEFAEELAWEHTRSMADDGAFEKGDEAFAAAYHFVRARYENALRHSAHIQSTAATALAGLLSDAGLELPVRSDGEGAMHSLNVAMNIIAAAMLWSIASAGQSLITDDEWDNFTEDQTAHIIYLPLDGADTQENDSQ
jgi:hypothetical protein